MRTKLTGKSLSLQSNPKKFLGGNYKSIRNIVFRALQLLLKISSRTLKNRRNNTQDIKAETKLRDPENTSQETLRPKSQK